MGEDHQIDLLLSLFLSGLRRYLAGLSELPLKGAIPLRLKQSTFFLLFKRKRLLFEKSS